VCIPPEHDPEIASKYVVAKNNNVNSINGYVNGIIRIIPDRKLL
jgi:hypothetical protein